ncbi:MAG: TRAP transporter substrate-binding protein DctP [Pseudomonadota bacterium]
MRWVRFAAAFAVAATADTAIADDASPDNVMFRLGHFLPAEHPMSVYLQGWANGVNTTSDGRITIEIFPSEELVPAAEIYDATRSGVIDIGWIFHGATPERFPLTSLIDIPFTVDSAVHGAKVLNEPALRETLDGEHSDVKVLYLFTHQPGQIFTARTAVKAPSDLEGLRIHAPSIAAKIFLEDMGAMSVDTPSIELSAHLEADEIDGVATDHGWAGLAFQLGGLVDYVTEFDAYVTSYALIMNKDAYASIPDDLKVMFDDSVTDVSHDVGGAWDSLDDPGRQALVEGGAEIITPSDTAMLAFVAAAEAVKAKILEERGDEAVRVRAMMEELAQGSR